MFCILNIGATASLSLRRFLSVDSCDVTHCNDVLIRPTHAQSLSSIIAISTFCFDFVIIFYIKSNSICLTFARCLMGWIVSHAPVHIPMAPSTDCSALGGRTIFLLVDQGNTVRLRPLWGLQARRMLLPVFGISNQIHSIRCLLTLVTFLAAFFGLLFYLTIVTKSTNICFGAKMRVALLLTLLHIGQ